MFYVPSVANLQGFIGFGQRKFRSGSGFRRIAAVRVFTRARGPAALMAGSAQRAVRRPEAATALIVATRRLQRQRLLDHAEQQQGAGRRAWPTPLILTWQDWLSDAWRRCRNGHHGEFAQPFPALLYPVQELALWEQIVRADTSETLLNMGATANSAATTWRLLHEHELSLDVLDDGDPDVRAWSGWAREFTRLCRARSWISMAELPARLIDVLQQEVWQPPAELTFAGFISFTPLQQKLMQALRDCGVAVHVEQHDARPAARLLAPCQDPRDELIHAAQWARHLLQSGVTGSIGIVVRDLESLRGEVDTVFRAILQPQDVANAETRNPDLFHVSLGHALADHPLVADALLLLRWYRQPLSSPGLARVLRSPFLRGCEQELLERAELDARLREFGWREISITGLLHHLQRSGRCPLLKEGLRAASEVTTHGDGLTPGEWAERFTTWLKCLGWPGSGPLDSAEYQTLNTWREMISRFASIGLVQSSMSVDQALDRLMQLTRSRTYQPLMDPAPVQVLGLSEAPGLRFEHLWIAGMSEDDWPPAPRPDPFLPVRLQRQAGMPGAHAAQTLADARAVTDALCSAADHIVVSYPRQKLEQQLAISPLFAGPARAAPARSDFPGAVRWLAARPETLQTLKDQTGPAWRDEEPMRGGAAVFQDQALCPFRNYARRRLRAHGLPQLVEGVSAAEHGSLVHRCLAALWRHYGDQQTLNAAQPGQLTERVDEVVDQALADSVPPNGRFARSLARLQRQRLIDLLHEWLRVERTRPSFRVRATEAAMTVRFAAVSVQLQVDRIDETDNGLLVLDYKTGAPVSPGSWFDRRPEQPQLPVYALACDPPVQGIAFAWVRRGGGKFAGVCDQDMAIPGVKPRTGDDLNWTAQLLAWRSAMEQLGEEISAGWAAVAPKHYRACQTCDLQPLCRIHELGANGQTDDE